MSQTPDWQRFPLDAVAGVIMTKRGRYLEDKPEQLTPPMSLPWRDDLL